MKIAIIDFETTGLDTSTCEPLQVAVSIFDFDAPEAEPSIVYSSFIKNTLPIPAAASAIHGIHDRDLLDAPSVETVTRELLAAIGDLPIAAYNLPYDGAILERMAGKRLPWSLCVLVAMREIDRYKPGKSLSECCARRGIAVEDAHDARADVLMTVKLLQHIRKRLCVLESVEDLYRYSQTHGEAQEQRLATFLRSKGKRMYAYPWRDRAVALATEEPVDSEDPLRLVTADGLVEEEDVETYRRAVLVRSLSKLYWMRLELREANVSMSTAVLDAMKTCMLLLQAEIK